MKKIEGKKRPRTGAGEHKGNHYSKYNSDRVNVKGRATA